MMKRIVSILLAAMLLATLCCFPTSAAEYTPKNAKAVKATAIIDAQMEDIWKETDALEADLINKTIIYNPSIEATATATVYLLWDETYLYVYADVLDPDCHQGGVTPDGIEIQVDENNDKTGTMNVQGSLNGKQFNDAAGSYQVFSNNTVAGFGDHYEAGKKDFLYAVALNNSGYVVEMAIPWSKLTPEVGTKIGLEIQINDNITGANREGLVTWNSDACLGWQDTEAMGTIEFVDSPEGYVPPETTAKPESTTPETTAKPETTTKDETTKADDTTKADETDKADGTGKNDDATKPADTDKGDQGGANTGLIVGIVIAVVVVVAVVVIVIKKKKA